MSTLYLIHRPTEAEYVGEVIHQPVELFTSQAAAKRRVLELEREIRKTLNPFRQHRYRTLNEIVKDKTKFTAILKELKIDKPPTKKSKNEDQGDVLAAWWAENIAPLPEDVRLRVWDSMGMEPNFTIAKIKLQPK
jgi:hypothetical protein